MRAKYEIHWVNNSGKHCVSFSIEDLEEIKMIIEGLKDKSILLEIRRVFSENISIEDIIYDYKIYKNKGK